MNKQQRLLYKEYCACITEILEDYGHIPWVAQSCSFALLEGRPRLRNDWMACPGPAPTDIIDLLENSYALTLLRVTSDWGMDSFKFAVRLYKSKNHKVRNTI